MTTITVTINIATGNKNEGNSVFQINIPENYLDDNPKYVRRTLMDNFSEIINPAIESYKKENK